MKYEKVCPYCGTVFETDNSHRKFCGKECWQRVQLIKRGLGNTYVKTCAICGKEFDTGRKRQIYCSQKCRTERSRRYARGYYQTNKYDICKKRKEKRRLLKETGLCIKCGKRPPVTGKTLCFNCALQASEGYYRRKELNRKVD